MEVKRDLGFWEGAVERAHGELAEMRAERDELSVRVEELNAEILLWERILASLKPIASNTVSSPVQAIPGIANASLSDACLTIINTVNTNLTARAIRDILEASGYQPNGKHNNALASIHGVLKRLAESGKIESQETEGKTFYRAKPFSLKIETGGSSNKGFFSNVGERAARKAVEELTRNPRQSAALAKAMEDAEKFKGKI